MDLAVRGLYFSADASGTRTETTARQPRELFTPLLTPVVLDLTLAPSGDSATAARPSDMSSEFAFWQNYSYSTIHPEREFLETFYKFTLPPVHGCQNLALKTMTHMPYGWVQVFYGLHDREKFRQTHRYRDGQKANRGGHCRKVGRQNHEIIKCTCMCCRVNFSQWCDKVTTWPSEPLYNCTETRQLATR